MLKKFFSILISKVKKEPFIFDKNLPDSYIARLIVVRLIMLLRGIVCVHRVRLIFVGKNTILLCKRKLTFISPLSIGDNCYIDALSTQGIKFGKNVSISRDTGIECSGTFTDIGVGFSVGDNVGLGRNCFYGCAGGIKIGSNTIVGNFVSMHSENHNFQNADIPIRLQGVNRKGISIGENCWIGAKVTILDGVVVEDGCIIAAGSVVNAGTYNKNSIYAGVPAKYIKSRF